MNKSISGKKLLKEFQPGIRYEFSEEQFKVATYNYQNFTWWKGLDGKPVEVLGRYSGKVKRSPNHIPVVVNPNWCKEVEYGKQKNKDKKNKR